MLGTPQKFVRKPFVVEGYEVTRAYPGDWVLSAGTGFKVYTQKAFSGSFEEQSDRMFDVVERMDARGEQEETLFDEGLTEPETREILNPQFQGSAV
jgi:hypothetical protein